MDEATVKVRKLERGFLVRWWWGFPLVAVLFAMLTGGGFWAWVDGGRPWLDWHQAFTLRAVTLAVAGLAVVWAWRIFLARKCPGWTVWALAATGFASVEVAVRIPLAQTAFWLAAEARIPAKANMSFMHDVCHVRLDEAARGKSKPRPAVILVGSSQVVEGVDEELLARLLPERAIVKRAVSAMRPIGFLVAEQYIPMRCGDVVVHYLSEFDFADQDTFPYAWFRPFAGWNSLCAVLRAVGRNRVFKDWRGVLDCSMAATSELWRQRDWARTAFFRFWGVSAEDLVFDARIPADKGGGTWFAGSKGGAPVLAQSPAQKKAFEVWVERVEAMGASIVVFEGQVNPAWRTPERQNMHEATGEWLSSLSAQGLPLTCIGLDEDFPQGDWRDMTHLNEKGREKLTRGMARFLHDLGK